MKNKETLFPCNIKAIGEWELDVLAIPFGSKDAHGEYFTAETNLHLDRYPNPAIHYYHGFTPEGYPQGDPVEIGEVKSFEVRADGVWYRVLLDKTRELARRVMEAARKGLARASSGTAEHLRRPLKPSGPITNWPIIEVSLFDIDRSAGRLPANNYAVAVPVMKALFERAGIEYPDEEPEPAPAQQVIQVQAKARLFLLEK